MNLPTYCIISVCDYWFIHAFLMSFVSLFIYFISFKPLGSKLFIQCCWIKLVIQNCSFSAVHSKLFIQNSSFEAVFSMLFIQNSSFLAVLSMLFIRNCSFKAVNSKLFYLLLRVIIIWEHSSIFRSQLLCLISPSENFIKWWVVLVLCSDSCIEETKSFVTSVVVGKDLVPR